MTILECSVTVQPPHPIIEVEDDKHVYYNVKSSINLPFQRTYIRGNSNCRLFDLVLLFFVGCGGALVKTMTFNRRVVGSTPTIAATVSRQLVYGHFVYDTSSTDISSTM